MQLRGRARAMSLGVLLVLTLTVTTVGCASWALSSGSTLEQAGEKVHSQVQVMSLVAQAAMRDHPPTVSLQVMLDDAETVLSEEEQTITELPAQRQHRAEVLGLLRTSRDILHDLRSSIDHRRLDALRATGQELGSIAGRLEALGMA